MKWRQRWRRRHMRRLMGWLPAPQWDRNTLFTQNRSRLHVVLAVDNELLHDASNRHQVADRMANDAAMVVRDAVHQRMLST